MDALEELTASQRVKDVKARYCRFLDTKNWEGFEALFTPDAVLDVSEDTGTAPYHGRAAIARAVLHAVQHAKTAHHVHSPEIIFDGPDAADVVWAMQDRVVWEADKSPVPGASALTGYGHYHEHYVREDGAWFIASLKLSRLMSEFQP